MPSSHRTQPADHDAGTRQHQRLANDQSHHAPAPGANRDPNGHFAPSQGDGMRERRVETDAAYAKRQHTKQLEQRHTALAID